MFLLFLNMFFSCDRNITLTYATFIFGGYLFLSGPVVFDRKEVALPINVWTPYTVEDTVPFILTYLHQILVGSFVVGSQLGTDTFFVAVLLRLSSQIDILKYRLQEFNRCDSNNGKKRIIIDCVQYHNRINR